MNSLTERLKAKMKELDLTQEELAHKLGVTRSAVAHYVQGTRHPPVKQVIKLASILKTDPAWLQFGKSKDAPTPTTPKLQAKKTSNRIPVLDWHQALHCDSLELNTKGQKYLDYFNYHQVECYALLIKGDSMMSSLTKGVSFNPGSYVVIEPEKTPSHGDYVITAAGNKKEAVLRQYIQEGGIIYLKPLNPQYPLIQMERSTKILGVVIASINFTQH